MTFLPIVERELRVAARKRSTFWVRVAAATVALIIGGGFLITAMNHVIGKIVSAERQKGGSERRIEDATRARVQKFASRFIVGIDLNPNLVKAAKMNMVMNNDGGRRLVSGQLTSQSGELE